MDNTYATFGNSDFVPFEEDGIRFNKDNKRLVMEHEKDKKKLFCKNIMCPCNNAEGDDGTAPLEEYYCLSGFFFFSSAWMAVELINEPNSK